MGYEHIAGGSLPEKMMNGRYAYLAFTSNGKLELVQVGRVGKNGLPVAREWDAGGDLAEYFGDPIVHFVPYP